ncbi:amidohydrolase [Allofranklinella schreckenbergeri]|uniref:Amidohydrolase n=1 Tax=Allofranklinella schreckenbergeri TaxID=1076744 RepID=A0A3M6QT21_9BURK|nr:M20 aminoacylase family protein [Allofranklinella schreckenbergeri]RMX06175.1 amidohydrolase [Allofranklinella schreckenbergeri]
MKLIDSIVRQAEALRAIRQDIHAHPELGYEEHRTADLVASLLQQWGIEVHRGLGKTGVVGIVHGRDGGASGKAIGLRADMDALPMQEANTFAHASRTPGKMHACGHDGHTTMLLAAAQHWGHGANRDFDGTVYLIFQPAEEGGGGARAMIEDGLFRQFPMDAVFGMHNWPGMAPGEMAVADGPVMASSNEFHITIRGKGGHAAMPHVTIDPMPVACQMVMGFQTIVSRNVSPVEAAVISVTMIHGGEANNVVPNACRIDGTVRTFKTEVLDLVQARMEKVARDIASAFECEADFVFERNYPATVNSSAEVALARRVMGDMQARALEQIPSMGAEDFSFMLLEKPGAYCFIGNGDGAHRPQGHAGGPCTLHNPSYDFNDALIPLGGTYWVRLAQRWFAEQAGQA